MLFVEFTFIKNKVCKVFKGNILLCVHKSLNVSDGNVEVFKLVDGGVMEGITNSINKGKKGGMPSMLFKCMKDGGVFGALSVDRFYREVVKSIMSMVNGGEGRKGVMTMGCS